MSGKNSMLDSEFLEDEDFEREEDLHTEHEVDLGKPEKAKTKEEEALEIEVVDDTPDKDKGKWVADDQRDGEPEFANEEEIANYSQDVQKRIKKYTARTHAERRRADELQRQLEEAQKVMAGLIQRNNHYSDLIENGEKVLLTEHSERIKSQLEAAKRLYREAHEAGDPNGMVTAQEQIAQAAAALDRLSTHRPVKLERADPRQFQPQPQPQRPMVSDATADWQERNSSWFGKDQAMTAFAMGVHAQITSDGVRAESPEYWRRLDKEIHDRFPERFRGERSQRRSVVAPVTRTSANGRQKVTLTETQVKLARRLGITAEQYAAQLVKEQSR